MTSSGPSKMNGSCSGDRYGSVISNNRRFSVDPPCSLSFENMRSVDLPIARSRLRKVFFSSANSFGQEREAKALMTVIVFINRWRNSFATVARRASCFFDSVMSATTPTTRVPSPARFRPICARINNHFSVPSGQTCLISNSSLLSP